MSWMKTILDGIRGKANDTGEAIASDPSIAIPAMEQSIRDAEGRIDKSKNALTDLMAQEKLTAKAIADIEADIAEYEGYAVAASEKEDEGLLNELIDKIGETEGQLGEQRAVHDSLITSVAELKATIAETERGINSMKVEIKTIKATEDAQRAALEVSAKHSGASSSTRLAAERMQRIKEKQAERKAKMEAAKEIESTTGDGALKDRLAKAGIGAKNSNRDDILARINSKKQS